MDIILHRTVFQDATVTSLENSQSRNGNVKVEEWWPTVWGPVKLSSIQHGTSCVDDKGAYFSGEKTEAAARFHRDRNAFQSLVAPENYTTLKYGANRKQAVDLCFQVMDIQVLTPCSDSETSEDDKRLQHQITEKGPQSYPPHVSCKLIDMHGKSEDIKETERNVELLPLTPVETWNALISFYNHNQKGYEGLRLFKRMQQEGIEPSRVTFLCALKACSITADLNEGRRIHILLIQSGLEFAMFVENALIDMYVKCESLDEACSVFSRSEKPDIMSYNVLLGGFAEIGEVKSAILLFALMQDEGILYDEITFINMLKACCTRDHLHYGQQMHARVVELGLEFAETVGNSLVHAYVCCESVDSAKVFFERMNSLNVVTWTTLITGYSRSGQGPEALELLGHMRNQGIEPNEVTYLSIIKACVCQPVVERGESVHVDLVEVGQEGSLPIGNALIDMYGKLGKVEDATTLFLRMPLRNVVTWTALISGYSQQNHASEALLLLDSMQNEGFQPNPITFAALLNACNGRDALHQGRQIHGYIVKNGWDGDAYLGNSLVGMYFDCQCPDDAVDVFSTIPFKDVITWNILISGYVQQRSFSEALWTYQQMYSEPNVEPDSVTFVCTLKACLYLESVTHGTWIHAHIIDSNQLFDPSVGSGLVELYARFGHIEDACRVFNSLPERNVVTWNILLKEFADSGHGNKTLELFSIMQESDLKPDAVTLLCSIKACASIGALQQGQCLHIQTIQLGLDTDLSFGNSIISMYCGCGSMCEAQLVFDKLPIQDKVSWSTLISGYSDHNHHQQALNCYERMLTGGLQPDLVTLVCLLSACSRGRFVDEGLMQFNFMRNRWGLQPAVEHYNALVELLGCVGATREAEDLLDTIPFEKNAVGWMSLLSASKDSNESIARRCFDQIVKIDSGNASAYIIMGNLYTQAGRHDEAREVEELRKLANAWKKPAKAFIEIDNHVHEFVVGDRTHPQRAAIYTKLHSLDGQLKKEGYCAKLDSLINFSENEEKERALCSHSEKLAIAFGLISSEPSTTLRITKNIRMCYDCHTVTKLISKVETRSIILKDSYCIHQFANGVCSCEK